MKAQALAVDYCYLIESNPEDSGSDLLGVRRVYTPLTYPEPGKPGAGEWHTYVDHIVRSGNGRGKVAMSVKYAGCLDISELDLGANPLADWVADAEAKHGGPINLENLA